LQTPSNLYPLNYAIAKPQRYIKYLSTMISIKLDRRSYSCGKRYVKEFGKPFSHY
jgi:hypothetical protein